MKCRTSRALFGVAMVTAGTAVRAAPMGTLDLRLVATAANTPDTGLYNIQIQARATGTGTAGQGDGGLSDLQFNITSNGAGKATSVAAGTGPLAGKSKVTWDPAVTGAFSTVNPNRSDAAPADGDQDVVGGAFFDSNNFTKTDLAVGAFQTIATVQFQLLIPSAGETVHITPSNGQYYDFVNGVAPNFRNTFAKINTADASFPTPEPTSLVFAGAATCVLMCRRRRA
jgi:hypothetical protein